jgi:hypothetical protein
MKAIALLLAAALSATAQEAPPAPAPAPAKAKPSWNVNAPPGVARTVPIDTRTGTWMGVDVSPDGKRLVFDLLGDLYTLPIEGGKATALTTSIAWDMQPRWSPDGKRLAFMSDAGGGDNIWVMNVDGSDKRQVTKEDFRLLNQPSWSKDGRFIVANAGVLLTQVEYLKHTEHKDFAIVDAAMNDLIRPALYQAWMDVSPVQPREGEARNYDLVGPICETGDFLAKDRQLVLAEGDLLAVRSAGAYGFVMSSNYNTRPRGAEVLVDGDQVHLLRERETIASLFAGEKRLTPGA